MSEEPSPPLSSTIKLSSDVASEVNNRDYRRFRKSPKSDNLNNSNDNEQEQTTPASSLASGTRRKARQNKLKQQEQQQNAPSASMTSQNSGDSAISKAIQRSTEKNQIRKQAINNTELSINSNVDDIENAPEESHEAAANDYQTQNQDDNNNNDNDNDNDHDHDNDNDNDGTTIVAQIANEEAIIRQTEDRVKQELIRTAAHAEIIDYEQTKNDNSARQSKRFIAYAILAFFLILAIVVGAAVAIVRLRRRRRQENDTTTSLITIEKTQSPTISLPPSYYPSNQPTISPSTLPSDFPSALPSNHPTLYPTSQPSFPPSPVPTSPMNEQCSSAIPLSADNMGNVYPGDLYFTNSLDTTTECHGFDFGATSEFFGPSRWYSFTAPNDGNIAIILCRGTQSIIEAKFTDTCETGAICFFNVASPITSFGFGDTTNNCPSQTAYIFNNLFPGLTYTMLLHLPPRKDFPDGYPERTMVPSGYPTPENGGDMLLSGAGAYTLQLSLPIYFCKGATQLEFPSIIPLEGLLFQGVIAQGATVVRNNGICGNANNQDSPGVWFTIPGDFRYQDLTITVCNRQEDKPLQVSIYSDCSGSSSCLVGSSNGCTEPLRLVPNGSESYRILVSTQSSSRNGSSEFTIQIDRGEPGVGLRLLPFALQEGQEFDDPNSYQSKALTRTKGQVGINDMSDTKIIQYYSLYCIYFATNAVPNPFTQDEPFGWFETTGWDLIDLDPCDGFFGISCDEATNTQVVAIDLYSNDLTGVFPPEVILLSSDGPHATGAGRLVRLDVFGNPFLFNNSDNSWMTLLGSTLEELYFGFTSFVGNIPKLPQGIQSIDCAYSLVTGGLEGENFIGLDNLNSVNFEGNVFNSPIPSELALLPNLQFLYVGNADITGDLSFMEGMSAIVELWVHDNPGITGSIYPFIGNLTTLGSLALNGCDLTGKLPIELGNLVDMQYLWLYGNKFLGQIPSELGSFTALNLLEFENNDFTGSMPMEICNIVSDSEATIVLGADCDEIECSCCTCCSVQECLTLSQSI